MRSFASPLSRKVREYYVNPRNFKRLKDADASARITGPCGDTMEMYLKVTGDRVREIAFHTDGCSPTVACGSAVVDLGTGRTVTEVRQIDPVTLLAAVGGLPESHRHCAALAVSTLHQALSRLPMREKGQGES